MSKRTQKDSGEERVTAKSKPTMSLVSRCSERTPDVLPSTASESPGKTRHENQFPLSSRTEQHHRTGRPVEDAYSSSCAVKLGLLKSGNLMNWVEDGTGRPVVFAQHTDRFIVENDNMVSYTEAESELSLKSRSFLHRVNDADSETFVMGSAAAEFVNKVKDQVRSRQKGMSNVAESGEEHSTIWGMFMAATMNAATFMGKNFSTIQNFIMNFEDLTLKQMFDVTAQLVNDQEEIHGLDKILVERILGDVCH